ncbi:dipeptide ABC transporter ATP-binding protein [Nakamurella sp. YIM 132087]|uniref:Dipeptide ABC transporter ATP-binding protein n=1 Tax=Nakamurella alba TaxID=2665158 RepID=A0A7K1FEC2_9ACTN|nr:ABC transporter ATP-binding protein [Nakamurella alba]MTD12448.1 dipeptide ABC transporter ATP-binding protein [Nakamurella alba]
MSALITVEGLSVGFRSANGREVTEVVHDLSFELRAGECLAIVGESGSGKTVTARALVGLNGPRAVTTATRLEVGGHDLRSATDRQWRRIRGGTVGLVLQDALVSLDPLRTVGAEIGEVLHTQHVVPRRLARGRAVELLGEVGVPSPEFRVDQYAHQLSGGLRQRALIASALAADPPVLLADEPTTALDVTVQAQVLDVLRSRLTSARGIVLISHDLAVVAGIADRVLVMQHGRIVEAGPTAAVLREPQHPYTRQLLAAVPSAGSRGRYLSVGTSTPGTAEDRVDAVVHRPALPTRTVDRQRTVLSARGLRKVYPGRRGAPDLVAVDDVSFELAAGEVLGIVGESGSGKSTVASLVLGLQEADSGVVELDGQGWSAVPERDRRPHRRRIQFISQDPLSSFDPRWTVGRVIAESTAELGLSAAAQRSRAVTLLDRVGLGEDVLDRAPRTLSGGQRQRVAIARALAPEPDVLICDEPTSALDVSVQAQVLDLLAELQAERGTAVLFVSHDLGVVHHLADRVLVLKDGRAVETGDVDQVFFDPQRPYTRQLVASLPSLVVA